MKQVITPQESGRLDEAAADHIDVLMDRAGFAVALAAAEMGVGYGSRVVVLAGKGNNGGDGYVAARYLGARGAHVRVYVHRPPRAGTAAERAFRAAQNAGIAVLPWTDVPQPADLIIDALFGVGFAGSLPDDIVPWLDAATPVLSVDLPSGVDAATGSVKGQTFLAARCVTFHAYKPGHLLGEGPDRCGRVTVVDIGLEGGDPTLLVCEEEDARRPARPRTAHKWSAGSVVVIGGSPGLTGAALLAAEAALNMGAGAVTVMCPHDLQSVYASLAPGLMSRGVGRGSHFTEDDVDEILNASRRFDVMVLGPGLGLDVGEFVTQIVLRWPKDLLIDADGINALSGTGAVAARQSPTILTPHAGEFHRLTGEDPTLEAATEVASATGDVVVVKGNPTLVIGAERWVVTSGGPELATIGTGDVLAGMIAALWARGLDGEAAARSGAYWHGRAAADLGAFQTVTAADLAGFVGVRLVRPTWVEVDLAAIRHNVAAVAAAVAPAAVCAVVKADGYGHGDVPVAEAALAAGADWLAVALVSEGVRLREADITAPILLLSEPPPESADRLVRWRLTPTIYTQLMLDAVAGITDGPIPYPVHVKVDTGMHRVGAPADLAIALAERITADPALALEGVWTHLAVAEEDPIYTAKQLARFAGFVDSLVTRGIDPGIRHCSNTAGALGHEAARFDMVRLGLGMYGMRPAPDTGLEVDLRPAMRVVSQVSHVRRYPAGTRLSYGRRRELPRDATVATVPIGYADGVSRRLSAMGGEVLIGGVRHPFAGTVTMDQVVVDVGDAEVSVGDEVVLLGVQKGDAITADEWADRLSTINYEMVCRFGPRLPRRYVDGAA